MGVTRGLIELGRRDPRTAGIAIVTILALVVWLPVYLYLVRLGITDEFHHLDFGVYVRTVDLWRGGDPLYVEGFFGGWLYPPVYVLAFVPFAALGFETGGWVWTVGSVLALWVALQALIATYGLRLRWFERLVLLWAVVGFHPVLYGMRLGQASIALAALTTVAFVAFERDRRRPTLADATVSGGLTAIAGTVKLFYAPIGAHLLQDARRFVGALATGVILAAISLLVFGIDAHLGYLEMLRWGEDWGRDPLHPRLWFPGYYRPLYAFGPAALLVRAIGVLAIVSLVLWTRGRGADREAFVLGIVAVPLVGPQVSVHDLTLLLPAIVALLAIELRRDGQPVVPIVALLLVHLHAYGLRVMVSLPPWVPASGIVVELSPLLQPALLANLLLVGLAGYRLYAYRPLEAFTQRAE